jgi:hypothetical protein
MKPSVRPQRTTNVGKKPDPKTNKKDEKPKPVKKEEKKEDNKVRLCTCRVRLKIRIKGKRYICPCAYPFGAGIKCLAYSTEDTLFR